MRSRRVALTTLLAVLVAGGLVGAACGGSSSGNTPTPQKTAPPAATSTKAAGATTAPTKAATSATTAAAGSPTVASTPRLVQVSSVKIEDFQFNPATVTLLPGSTVIWLDSGPSTHTVTADDGSFDSGNLSQGKTYSHTFDTAGTYAYHCSIHPNMKAQIVISP